MKRIILCLSSLCLLALLSSAAQAQVTLPIDIGYGNNCQGDDASPGGATSNVLLMKRTQWGATNNSTAQSLKIWCPLSGSSSGTKMQVTVYDRNGGNTTATNVVCHAQDLNSDGKLTQPFNVDATCSAVIH